MVVLRITSRIVSHPKTKHQPYYLQQDYEMQKSREEDTNKCRLLAKSKPFVNARYRLFYISQNQVPSIGLS